MAITPYYPNVPLNYDDDKTNGGRSFQGLAGKNSGIYYNGYTIPPTKSRKLQSEPVYDESGRFVKYMHYTLNVEFLVLETDEPGKTQYNSFAGKEYGEPNTDLNIETIRKRLQEEGRTLILIDEGLGDIVVNWDPTVSTGGYLDSFGNDPVYHYDVMHGPKPKLLVCESVMGAKVQRISWQLDFFISDLCTTGDRGSGEPSGSRYENVTEINYEVNYSYNSHGILTRVLQIEVERPSTWRTLNDIHAVDTPALRELLGTKFINLLDQTSLKSKRQITYQIAKDNKHILFTITDEEYPSENPLFPGTLAMEADHNIHSTLFPSGEGMMSTYGFTQWENTLTADITIAPGTPRWMAWWAFLDVFRDRVSNLEFFPYSSVAETDGPGQYHGTHQSKPSWFLITDLNMTEHIYSRTFTFAIQWYSRMELPHFFENSRFLAPLLAGDAGWAYWQQYATIEYHHNQLERPKETISRNGNEKGSPGDPSGHNHLCDPDVKPFQGQPEIRINVPPAGDDRYGPIMEPDDTGTLREKGPWSDYKSFFRIEEDVPLTRHTPVGGGDLAGAGSEIPAWRTDPNNIPDDFGFAVEDLRAGAGTSVAQVLQVRGRNSYTLTFSGHALRANQPIPMPRVVSFGGQPVYRLPGARWEHRQLSPSSSRPTYLAMWEVSYAMEGKPIQRDNDGSQNGGSGGDLIATIVTDGDSAFFT